MREVLQATYDGVADEISALGDECHFNNQKVRSWVDVDDDGRYEAWNICWRSARRQRHTP